MILIIGGSFQGKEEFAKKLIGQQKGGEENWEQLVCRGDEPWQKALEKPCLVNFHGFIRQLQETEEAEKETEESSVWYSCQNQGIRSGDEKWNISGPCGADSYWIF